MDRIALSLAGHTNLGKTTLARTLLRRDIGVVDDRPHVTDVADGHVLAGDPQAEIVLWDLPGFGDSIKLRKRLQGGGLAGWLATTFDRWLDRPLWCGQQSLRNAKDQADVIVYLVDALADPVSSPEVAAELAALAWTEKPILLLLNQTGLPDHARDLALVRRWRDAFSEQPLVREVLALDGWTRCWVQEVALLRRVEPLLPMAKQGSYRRLVDDWTLRTHHEPFVLSMDTLGKALAETARDRVLVPRESIAEKLMAAATRKSTAQSELAKEELMERVLARGREYMDQLLLIHGIDGVPRERLDSLVAGLKSKNPGAPPELWGLLGAIGSGALGGLLADFKAGGLTFGGGTVAGATLGGMAFYALGYGFRKIRKDGQTLMEWTPDFLVAEWKAAAMRYLCVAHMGRGRGHWEEPLPETLPGRWKSAIERWTSGREKEVNHTLASANPSAITALISLMIQAVFAELYPGEDPWRDAGQG